MSRFKAPVRPKAGSRPTVNLAGGEAYDRDPKVALASYVLTSMVQDTFYQSAEAQVANVRGLVRKLATDGQLLFAAKAAVYARKEHGLRSISHVVAGEVAQLRHEFVAQRGAWGPEFFSRVVHRLDDMSEIAGYWIQNYASGDKKTLPNAMKRGFARVFEKAKPDLLSKWDGSSTRSLTLRQLAHLVHPKGGKDSAVFMLRGGKLAAAETHEVALSRAGQSGDEEAVSTAKAQAWADLLGQGKLRYLAALRNCRNIVEQAPDCVNLLCALLISEKDIRSSKVMPFQFLAAHDAVSTLNGPNVRKVLTAIEVGADLALSNVPKFDGPTLVCLDDSGSMMGAVVERHKKPAIVGAMFATALSLASDDCDMMLFSDDARYVTFSGRATLFGGIAVLTANLQPKGTNFHAPFQAANRPYARIILLSDAQGWMGSMTPDASLRAYEARHGCRPFIYSWDLVGSSTSQFPAPRVAALAGISDKVFDLMKLIESDPKAMVNAIEAVKLG